MPGKRGDVEREGQWQAALQERTRQAEQRAREAEKRARHGELVARRTVEAERKTARAGQAVAELSSVLGVGLRWPAKVEFERLRRAVDVPPLDLGGLSEPVRATPRFEPPPPGPIAAMFGGRRRYEQELAAWRVAYDSHVAGSEARERDRQRQVAQLEADHAATIAWTADEVDRHNAMVEALEQGVRRREKESVEAYLGSALRHLPLPPGFPRNAEVVVDPGSAEAVVQMELPSRDLVPTVEEYMVAPRTATVKAVQRSAPDVAARYRDVISQTVLLALRCVFGSDDGILKVCFNGHVRATDPATGERIYPCLVSVTVERAEFLPDASLAAVGADLCLQRLGAVVSPHPVEH